MPAIWTWGSFEMTKSATTSRWEAGRGTTRTEEWTGPRAAAEAFVDDAKKYDTYRVVDVTEANGIARVVIDISGEEDEDALWEASGTTVMKPLASHPYFYSASGHLVTEIATVEKILESGTQKLVENYITGLTDTDIKAKMSRYVGLRQSGVEEYMYPGVELRKIHNCATGRINSSMDLAWYAVGRVWSIAGTTREGLSIPAILPPAELVGAIERLGRLKADGGSLGLQYQEGDFDYTSLEFLKNPPTISQTGPGRWTLTLTWTGVDSWSRVLYPGGTWDPGKYVDER